VADPIGDMLEGAGHDETAIGESHEDDLVEVFVQHVVDDVADVRRQVHLRARQVDPLADARKARREHVVAGG
jgi:hypothetical protein